MNLKLKLLFLIFGLSFSGLLLVGYIAFQSAKTLSVAQINDLLGATSVVFQNNHPSVDTDDSEWKRWLEVQELLTDSQLNALLLDARKRLIAFNSSGNPDLETYLQSLGASPIPLDTPADKLLHIGGNPYNWNHQQLAGTNVSLVLFSIPKTNNPSHIFTNLVVPTVIAGGIALWASIWAALILSKLIIKTRENDLLDAMVRERTAELKDARDQAEASNRVKSELITTMSHELRTPLTSIIGAVRLIQSGAVGSIPKSANELIGIAWSNAQQLSSLLNDILDVERMDGGALDLNLEPLDLSELVKNSVKLNAGYATEYNVNVIVGDLAEAAIVNGDRGRLLQVMANLISNATKFSPPQETVTSSVYCEGGHASIAVSNYGPAIPENLHDTIFDKFVRGENNDSRNSNGAGLGLSIVKDIVEKHGGRISFNSDSVSGTTFTAELPLIER